MVRPKDQGTDWENEVEQFFQALGFTAELLRQRGANDIADIRATHPRIGGSGTFWIEAKWRTNLNPFKAIAKALGKVGDRPGFTLLFWKRTVLKEGNERRSQEGPPIVIMSRETFRALLLRLLESP